MTGPEVTAAMKAEDVDVALVERAKVAVREQVEATPGHVSDRLAERIARHALAAVVPDIQAQALEAEANEVDREVNERCAAELVADTRCDDCGLRYEERDQYGCQEPGRGHHYDQEELDGRAETLDAPTFYGDQLRRKAAGLRASTPEEPTDG